MRNSVATLRRIVFVFAFLIPSYGMAAECGKHGKVLKFLERKYKEVVISKGLIGPNGFMELLVSKTGSWTVLLTNTQGISCISAAGQNYFNVKPKKAERTPS